MAREGKKLELYEILAAKRAKGKMPPGFEAKSSKQANAPDRKDEGQLYDPAEITQAPGLIIDDAVSVELNYPKPAPKIETPTAASRRDTQAKVRERAPEPPSPPPAPPPPPPPPPEPPRPRTPREVVFALDTAFIFFTVVLGLVGSSYFLGYKRGQEERPVGLAGVGDIETLDPSRLGLRNLGPAPRATLRPPETDFTLVLRIEPASEDLPERLEMELAEAVAKGKQAGVGDIQGFIFRTAGNDPRYVLAVGLGKAANDTELNRLLQIYNKMEGITLSREQRPYIGCRIAPIRELGVPVY